ncbi:MAG: N-acetylmuramoyl-L-alanine amidase [Defluviitaleaceae bacterium]|nr:N-acetylmuramoyl-L-alanine amidase [Defluviitaleaceae bacterium]
MTIKAITLSSGHGKYMQGASGIINEVIEARRVANQVAKILRGADIAVNLFHENDAKNATDNVNSIIKYHNSTQRDLDVSIHFNDFKEATAHGTETLHIEGDTQTRGIASRISRAISAASGIFLRRGDGTFARTTQVGFLRFTNRPAVLLEVCFVRNENDVRLYQENFYAICHAIAEGIIGRAITTQPAPPQNMPNHEPSEWAKTSWIKATAKGITDGTNPQANASREQIIVILDRLGLLD